MDAAVKAARAAAEQAGAAVSCRSGCAACCRHLVPLLPAEAEELRREVAAMPAPRRRAVEERFAAVRGQLVQAGLWELLRDAPPPEGLPAIARDYFDAWITCPFLEQDRCTVYASRPTACRRHAVTSPPWRCATGEGVQPLQVETPQRFGRESRRAGAIADEWLLLPLLFDAPPAEEDGPCRT